MSARNTGVSCRHCKTKLLSIRVELGQEFAKTLLLYICPECDKTAGWKALESLDQQT